MNSGRRPTRVPWLIRQLVKNGELTHWGRVTHICVSELTIIGSDNGLSPSRRQAIIWTNAGILLIRPWGTNFSEILIEIGVFSFKKMHLKMLSAKCRPFCLGLNVLSGTHWGTIWDRMLHMLLWFFPGACRAELSKKSMTTRFSFSIITQKSDGTAGWNSTLWKTITYYLTHSMSWLLMM